MNKKIGVLFIFTILMAAVIPTTQTTEISNVLEPKPIQFVELEIGEICGGLLGITSILKNNGTTNATNVSYSIVLNGEIIFIGQNVSEKIGTLEPNGTAGMYDIPLIGFGPVEIKVTANANETDKVTKKAKGFVLLVYTIIH
ncbi:MAG: hypothetical protein ACOC80_03075 [Petrotogales bacterium]